MVLAQKEFDINDLIKNNLSKPEFVQQSNPNLAIENAYEQNKEDFKQAKSFVYQKIRERIENKNLKESEREQLQSAEHSAIMEPKSEMILLEIIREILRDSKYVNAAYDPMFPSLEKAIFEHLYGFKNMYKWKSFPDSPSAMIIGTKILFKLNGKFVEQKEGLESLEEVKEIIRLLKQANPHFSINEHEPTGELDLPDRIRVTIVIPPRAAVPEIMFRRFTINEFSFEKQAEENTIAIEDISLYKFISNKLLNTIVAGHVESGKTTFIKTIFSERPKDMSVILIEGHPETYLMQDFPERTIHEFYTRGGSLGEITRTVLRIDHDFVILQEVRGIEADYALDSASRGSEGVLMSYHVTEPNFIPEQLTQHIVDHFPNRKFDNELRRATRILDIGFTMSKYENPVTKKIEKKVMSMFEFVYEHDKDKAYINNLILFDETNNCWQYNSTISDSLKKKLIKKDPEGYIHFENLLKEREKISPLENPIQPIFLRDWGAGNVN